MHIKIRDIRHSGVIELEQLNEIVLPNDCVLGMDCASQTGLCLLDLEEGTPQYSIFLKRTTKESPVRYKVYLKRFVKDLLLNNPSIKHIGYEEPYIRNYGAATSLFIFQSLLEELLIEEEPRLDYLTLCMLPNKTWKKQLLGTLPKSNSEKEKELISGHITSLFPQYAPFEQDEKDAAGIALVMRDIVKGTAEVKRKPKIRAFKYELAILPYTAILPVLTELPIPETVLENGMIQSKLIKNSNVKKRIHTLMGEDDKVILFEVKTVYVEVLFSEYFHMLPTTDKSYVVAWRKNRKPKSTTKKR